MMIFRTKIIVGVILAGTLLGCQTVPKSSSASVPIRSVAVKENNPTVRAISVLNTGLNQYQIDWTADPEAYPIQIYWNEKKDAGFDYYEIPLAVVKEGTQATVQIPRYVARPYFWIKPKRGDGRVAAERFLRLEGQANCRDLGGYPSKNGGYVKWGQIYRCGQLNRLTANDVAILGQMGIVSNIDFRRPEEVEKWPNQLPLGAIRNPVPIDTGAIHLANFYHALDTGDMSVLGEGKIISIYQGWAQRSMKDFGDVVKRLYNDRNRPVVLTDLFGKDRTGMASAVILWMLGVDIEMIKAEYMLSEIGMIPTQERIINDFKNNIERKTGTRPSNAGVQPLLDILQAKEEYIQAGIDAIRAQYKSIDAYLIDGLGINPKDLHEIQKSLLDR